MIWRKIFEEILYNTVLCASNSESNGSNMIVLGSRGGAHEQIVPEIYTRVFEVLMRYRYPNRVSNWSSWCQKWRGLGLESIPEVLPVSSEITFWKFSISRKQAFLTSSKSDWRFSRSLNSNLIKLIRVSYYLISKKGK